MIFNLLRKESQEQNRKLFLSNFLNSFDIFLKSSYNIGTNTVWKYHRHLKKVLNDAIAMELIIRNRHENFKVKRGDANRDFLTVKEIKKNEKKKFRLNI